MNKEEIISNTIMFAGIMIFINIFQAIFGKENMPVGITVITAALVLLERDLTINPLMNLTKLLGINLFLLVFSVWSSNNMWLGIVLNFLALFIIGYLLSYNLKKPIFIPFGLQYLFMLYAPVQGDALSKRILGLIFGAFFVMASQFLVNKHKVSKTGMKILDNTLEKVLLKISLLKENKDLIHINEEIKECINTLKRIVYDKRPKDFYITKDGEIVTNILWSLERTNILLDKLKEGKEKVNYIQFLEDIYNSIKNIKNKDINRNNLQDIEVKYRDSDLNKIYVYEFIDIMENLFNGLSKIATLSGKEKNIIDDNSEIPEHFHKLAIHKRNFRVDSLRVSYGIRLGIVGVLTAFLTQYFHLSEGRWMAYTMFSVIQPYSENCKAKSRQRLEGTLIGVLIVFISFNLIENSTVRYLIVLLAGYLNPFARGYRELIIYVTVSAVASAALISGTTKFVLSRIIFVAIGVSMSLVANKYILPYEIKDGNKDLVKTYKKLVSQMLIDIKKDQGGHVIKNLFLIPALIEDRMKLTNFGADCSKEREFVYNQRILVNSIYNYYSLINKDKTVRENILHIIEEIKLLPKDNKEIVYKIEKYIQNIQSPKEKLLLKNILDIVENFNKANSFVPNAL